MIPACQFQRLAVIRHTGEMNHRRSLGPDIALDTPGTSPYNSSGRAGMAELADAADLKSAGEILVGSSPSPGTTM